MTDAEFRYEWEKICAELKQYNNLDKIKLSCADYEYPNDYLTKKEDNENVKC